MKESTDTDDTNASAPREFWIWDNGMTDSYHAGKVHVIEHSAYAALEKELETVKADAFTDKVHADYMDKENAALRAQLETAKDAANFNSEIGKRIAEERDQLKKQLEHSSRDYKYVMEQLKSTRKLVKEGRDIVNEYAEGFTVFIDEATDWLAKQKKG